MNSIERVLRERKMVLGTKNKDGGFTLIELLVVVIIIGILAAIAIPVFLNQRQGAWEAAVKSDIKSAQIAAETYATTNNGSYDKMTLQILKDKGYKVSDGVTITVSAASGTGYTLVGTHKDVPKKTWTFSTDTGKIVTK